MDSKSMPLNASHVSRRRITSTISSCSSCSRERLGLVASNKLGYKFITLNGTSGWRTGGSWHGRMSKPRIGFHLKIDDLHIMEVVEAKKCPGRDNLLKGSRRSYVCGS
jgi:hypothetical protein